MTEGQEKSRKDDSRPTAIRPLPLAIPQKHSIVTVNTERELLAMARPLQKRIAEDPAFSVMLLSNPVLALEKYGIKLTQSMRTHVLHALRHPKALRERRAALEKSLEKKLGEEARPNDPKWLAATVFRKRGIAPRAVEGAAPAYRTEDPGGFVAALKANRRPATNRYPQERRIKVTSRLGVAPPSPAVRRLDLDAPLPELPPAQKPPAELTLEQAWFYKDDPIVRDLVELGQIERRAFPFRTPGEFREIESGKSVDGFRAFVRAVRIDPGKRR
jgi:hypothetical protein